MKTADLIAILAADTAPTPPARVARLVFGSVAIGATAAAIILALWLGLRPLDAAMATGSFWMKAGYTVCLGGAGVAMVIRLARPGGRLGRWPWLALAAIGLMLVLASLEMVRAPAGHMRAMVMGQSWTVCSLQILSLALPVFFAAVWGLRRLAPTRLSLAGAAAGLLSGGVGATIYGLYCTETAAMFVVVWYSLAIVAAMAVGALLGPRLLRW